MAIDNELPQVQVLSDKRKQRIKACWVMMPDSAKWIIAINEVPKDKFRLGENDRKWKANFDWFINTDTPFMKLLEEAGVKMVKRKENTPSRFNTNAGYKKTKNGVSNKQVARAIGDILKGIV